MSSQRLHALRATFSSARIDALLVSFLPHIRYLTGFTGSNGVCLVTQTQAVFLSDGRYRQQARQEVRGARVIIAPLSLYEALASRVGRTLKGRVGIQEQYLPVGELNKLKKLFRTAKFVPTAGLVESLAAVKDDDEIAKIRAAVKLTDEVFDEVLAFIKPGVKELDIAAEVSYRHRLKGAEADAFEPIVASGVRGALPHARATRKTIRKGEMVTLDMGCRLNGYHSDLTRTVAVGKPPAELRRVYGIVREAQQRAVDAAAGGLSARALDAVARSFIRRHGYGTYFNHSLGHGLGLQVHEAPRLSKLSKETLASGNVVTIEPGIYIPNLGGVRIEDDVVIRNGTADVLNRAPKELLIL